MLLFTGFVSLLERRAGVDSTITLYSDETCIKE